MTRHRRKAKLPRSLRDTMWLAQTADAAYRLAERTEPMWQQHGLRCVAYILRAVHYEEQVRLCYAQRAMDHACQPAPGTTIEEASVLLYGREL